MSLPQPPVVPIPLLSKCFVATLLENVKLFTLLKEEDGCIEMRPESPLLIGIFDFPIVGICLVLYYFLFPTLSCLLSSIHPALFPEPSRYLSGSVTVSMIFFPTVHWQCHSYDCVTNILFSESCFSIFAEPCGCLICCPTICPEFLLSSSFGF